MVSSLAGRKGTALLRGIRSCSTARSRAAAGQIDSLHLQARPSCRQTDLLGRTCTNLQKLAAPESASSWACIQAGGPCVMQSRPPQADPQRMPAAQGPAEYWCMGHSWSRPHLKGKDGQDGWRLQVLPDDEPKHLGSALLWCRAGLPKGLQPHTQSHLLICTAGQCVVTYCVTRHPATCLCMLHVVAASATPCALRGPARLALAGWPSGHKPHRCCAGVRPWPQARCAWANDMCRCVSRTHLLPEALSSASILLIPGTRGAGVMAAGRSHLWHAAR